MFDYFWVQVGKIVWIDILLSGDNALVIAMACRGLAPGQRLWGMIFGAGAAVVLRIICTGTVASLMELPFLKLVGGLALLYIAIKLLISDDGENEVKHTDKLLIAIRTVVIADIVMSIDNVIAVAAAAHGNVFLLGLALALSIPIIVAGAAVITTFLNKFPILVWAGAGLLGWIAGEVIATDPIIAPYYFASHDLVSASIFGMVSVLTFGGGWRWQESINATYKRGIEEEI